MRVEQGSDVHETYRAEVVRDWMSPEADPEYRIMVLSPTNDREWVSEAFSKARWGLRQQIFDAQLHMLEKQKKLPSGMTRIEVWNELSRRQLDTKAVMEFGIELAILHDSEKTDYDTLRSGQKLSDDLFDAQRWFGFEDRNEEAMKYDYNN